MLIGKIIVAIAFGGLSFWCWKDIWSGLVHQKLSPFHRGYPPILRKDGELRFWTRFYNVLGLSVFTTCMLSMILLSEVTQWSYWEIILLRIGIIAYYLGEILQIPYRVTVPIVAYQNKSMNKVTRFFLIVVREMLVFVYMAGIIALGVYFVLYVKK